MRPLQDSLGHLQRRHHPPVPLSYNYPWTRGRRTEQDTTAIRCRGSCDLRPVAPLIGQPDLHGRVYGQATWSSGSTSFMERHFFLPATPKSNTHTGSIGSVLRSSASNAVDANNDRRCLSWAWYPRPEVRHGGSPTRARVGPHTRRPRDPLSPMRPMPKIQLSGPHPLSRERPHHDSKFYTKSSPPRLKMVTLYNNTHWGALTTTR